MDLDCAEKAAVAFIVLVLLYMLWQVLRFIF